jgi:uncharacterized protein (DUF1330 family)
MAKGYLIGLIKITNKNEFIENFAKKIKPFLEKNDGKFLSRATETHALEGRPHDINVIVEFGDYNRAVKLMESNKWNDIQEERRRNSNVSEGTFMLIKEGDVLKD